jgi:hypothetical protein
MKIYKLSLFSLVLFTTLLQKDDKLAHRQCRTAGYGLADELDMEEYKEFKGANVRMTRSIHENQHQNKAQVLLFHPLLHRRHINTSPLLRRILSPPQSRNSFQLRIKLHPALSIKIKVPDDRVPTPRKRKHRLKHKRRWLLLVGQGSGIGTLIPT